MRELFIDAETSGIPVKGHTYDLNYEDFPRIVQLAWEERANNGGDGHIRFNGIINQKGFVVPDESIAIHGITNEMCEASSWDHAQVLLWFLDSAQKADRIVGYNVHFDTSIIKANTNRIFGFESDTAKAMYAALDKDKRIDVCGGSMGYVSKMGWRSSKDKVMLKMGELYEKLFGSPMVGAHKADSDVHNLIRIYDHLLKIGVLRKHKQPVN